MPSSVPHVWNPQGGPRRLYSLRGVVEAHGVHESGWWIFKKRIPTLRIRINPDQLAVFNRIAQERMGTWDSCRNLQGIAGEFGVGMAQDDITEYPVGTQVGLTFGYAAPVFQFFLKVDPLALLNIQVMEEDRVLENEVEVERDFSI